MNNNFSETYLTSNIIYSGNTLNTSGCDVIICSGNPLNSVIADLYNTLCALETNCKVQVSSTDECCDYLQGKLISLDESIHIEKVSTTDANGKTCETLNLTTNAVNTPIVLYNNQTPSVIYNTGSLITYTLDNGTLVNDGDIIEIETYFAIDTEDSSFSATLNIYFGSLSMFTLGNILSIPTNPQKVKVKININRDDATHVSVNVDVLQLSSLNSYTNIYSYNNYHAVVSNLDSNDVDIETGVTAISGSGAITNNFLTVKYFNK